MTTAHCITFQINAALESYLLTSAAQLSTSGKSVLTAGLWQCLNSNVSKFDNVSANLNQHCLISRFIPSQHTWHLRSPPVRGLVFRSSCNSRSSSNNRSNSKSTGILSFRPPEKEGLFIQFWRRNSNPRRIKKIVRGRAHDWQLTFNRRIARNC